MTMKSVDSKSVSPEYVLGTNQAELERLGLQHRLWSDAAHSLWRIAGIQPGSNVLDIGCGPGFATFDLAQIVGAASPGVQRGEVLAIDESEPYLGHVAQQCRVRGLSNVRTLRSDVMKLGSTDSISPGGFDAAYARWVFCFVSDPGAVVQGVRRSLKAGGRLVVQDYFDYERMSVAPRRVSFAAGVAATGKSWRLRGGDPDIMGRLPGMLEAAGFDVTHLGVNQRIARPGEPMWHWPQTFWHNFLPVLVGMGLLTEAQRQEWLRDWDELSRTPGAFALLPPVFDLVAVKR